MSKNLLQNGMTQYSKSISTKLFIAVLAGTIAASTLQTNVALADTLSDSNISIESTIPNFPFITKQDLIFNKLKNDDLVIKNVTFAGSTLSKFTINTFGDTPEILKSYSAEINNSSYIFTITEYPESNDKKNIVSTSGIQIDVTYDTITIPVEFFNEIEADRYYPVLEFTDSNSQFAGSVVGNVRVDIVNYEAPIQAPAEDINSNADTDSASNIETNNDEILTAEVVHYNPLFLTEVNSPSNDNDVINNAPSTTKEIETVEIAENVATNNSSTETDENNTQIEANTETSNKIIEIAEASSNDALTTLPNTGASVNPFFLGSILTSIGSLLSIKKK